MATRALERFEEWDSEPFPGGYRALHDLAAEDFSGIVATDGARLCMLNGTVVGILDGSVEDFEDTEGTIYEAPSPALPLLALMQERNDEIKAKYYTEDTPISEVDAKLTDGNFSGYIELSENVLSGDYYLVYHAGRSMAVAFVGNSKQLLTDEEAFDRADGEVGIYQVRPAEVEPVEIPEPEADEVASGAMTGDAAESSEDDAAESSEDDSAAPEAGPDPPGPSTDADAAEAGPDAAGTGTVEADPDAGDSGVDGGSTSTSTSASGAADAAEGGEEGGTSTATDQEGAGADGAGHPSPDDGGDADAPVADSSGGAGSRPGASTGTGDGRETDASAGETADPGANSASRPDRARSEDVESGGSDRPGDREQGRPRPGPGPGPGPAGGGSGSRSDRGADSLETYSIPSLDPSRSASRREERTAVTPMGPRPEGGHDPGGAETGRDGGAGSAGDGATETDALGRSGSSESREPGPGQGAEAGPGQGAGGTDASPGPGAGDRPDAGGGNVGTDSRSGDAGAGTGADARIRELETELDETREELQRVETQLAEVRDERDALETDLEDLRREHDDLADERDALEADLEDLRRERDDLADERDALESEVENLESEVEHLTSQLEGMEAQFGASPDAEQRLTPAEALDGTDIFVRYESKGQATLETAHQGNASRSQVNENLGLEYHTQFDATSAAVAGKAFDTFLGETIQFRFVRWVIEDLLYEIQDTGKVAALQDLYDAIPRIDRAELNGTVTAEFTEDGGERRTQESFDVVMRDRMGNPLFVANMNDSRQAATESMMTSLVTASSHVGESAETLGASFLVTSSFFEPEALETAAEATSGGLLSRDKRESFVKLSRKRGYHLCLVEAREGKFHLAVPEL